MKPPLSSTPTNYLVDDDRFLWVCAGGGVAWGGGDTLVIGLNGRGRRVLLTQRRCRGRDGLVVGFLGELELGRVWDSRGGASHKDPWISRAILKKVRFGYQSN